MPLNLYNNSDGLEIMMTLYITIFIPVQLSVNVSMQICTGWVKIIFLNDCFKKNVNFCLHSCVVKIIFYVEKMEYITVMDTSGILRIIYVYVCMI